MFSSAGLKTEREIFTSEGELARLLRARGPGQEELSARADTLRRSRVSDKVYLRGIVEFSNECANDCLYCGIRASNGNIERYTMTEDEIVDAARSCRDAGYASLVLQSGERRSEVFIKFLTGVVERISSELPELRVTLSTGEQDPATYRSLYRAGARRYLLRIETSDEMLYESLHPSGMGYRARRDCLYSIRESGFQLGTGVMIGLPGQSVESLARDLLFMKDVDVDMVGMGPYVTAAGGLTDGYGPGEKLSLCLNMVALLRLIMPDINIAATTALLTLDPRGREAALAGGANVVMPVMTPERYRRNYTLYGGGSGSKHKNSFEKALSDIERSGCRPAFGEWGDSKHFGIRTGNVSCN